MTKNKEYVFICSALIDIPEILFQIEKIQNDKYIIFVTSHKYSYDFLCTLIDKKNIIFLNSKLGSNPKNIFNWLKEILLMIYLKIFYGAYKPKKVFFYAPIYDLIACFMVINIFKNSEIILSNPVFNEGINGYHKVSKQSILHRLYSILYGFPVHSYDNYRIQIFGGSYIPGIPKDMINSKFTLGDSVPIKSIQSLQQNKYLINHNKSLTNEKTIILDQGKDDFIGITNFDEVFERIISMFGKDNILMKTYYNTSTSPFEKYDFKKLDFKYPIEHYNLSGAKNVICIFTSGIGRVPEGNYNKISLLNLFKFKNDSEKINWKTFMDKIGDDILYPNSFDELESIINN